jgi:hypothetical protein
MRWGGESGESWGGESRVGEEQGRGESGSAWSAVWRRAVVLRTIHVRSSQWQSEEPAKVHELSSSGMGGEGQPEGRGSR